LQETCYTRPLLVEVFTTQDNESTGTLKPRASAGLSASRDGSVVTHRTSEPRRESGLEVRILVGARFFFSVGSVVRFTENGVESSAC